MSTGALAGVRVLELGGEIAAPYGTKLLADLGADVIKVESHGAGDPLRARGPFPGDRPNPNAAGLFGYLNANKRSIFVDLSTAAGTDAVLELVSGTDLVVESLGAGALERSGLGPAQLAEANPNIALARISPFGQTGPWSNYPATDLVVQAAGAWVATYGAAAGDPLRVGGRIPEYVAGSFAACSGLSAIQAAHDRKEPALVDLSILECLVGTLSYPMLLHTAIASLPQPLERIRFSAFGILPCKDGLVGINILTHAHWVNACEAVGLPEFADSQSEVTRNDSDNEMFRSRLAPFLRDHTAEEIVTRCQAKRLPAAVVGDPRTLLESGQLAERGFFVDAASGAFRQPGRPFRLASEKPRPSTPAPAIARTGAAAPAWHPRDEAPLGLGESRPDALPFKGLRVLDLGTFWAGPYMGMYLASLGADVIKVESIQRPDGFRFLSIVQSKDVTQVETGVMFQATNLGKRDVTLDLNQPAGRDLLLRLVENADILIENFAPRVMERFDLDYDVIRKARRDIIMVRMPGYGLEGPWRDYVGWAMAFSQACGISSISTDIRDGQPRNPGAFIDPTVAMHALVAIQAALAHRRRTAEGQMIEVAQVETAACMCPEPIIDYTMNGRVRDPLGNRDRDIAPQGVYPCREGGMLALSVEKDEQWPLLLNEMGQPEWGGDESLQAAAGRIAQHDAIDSHIASWTGELDAAEIASRLRSLGIAAAETLVAAKMYGHPQLEARGYYQAIEHPLSGERRYPVWPMRFSFHGDDVHPRATPLLGQHNNEILKDELGLNDAEIETLREQGVIGSQWKGAHK